MKLKNRLQQSSPTVFTDEPQILSDTLDDDDGITEMKMTSYEDDIIRWSEEQSLALLERRFGDLDLEHLADEVLDVGKAEKREFERRLSTLFEAFIRARGGEGRLFRLAVATVRHALRETPSLDACLEDREFVLLAWMHGYSGALAAGVGVEAMGFEFETVGADARQLIAEN